MKTNLIFYIGLAVNALLFIISLSNIILSLSHIQDGIAIPLDGFSNVGRLALWLIPLFFAALMGIAFWLKHIGKILPANILLWIPALPALLSFLLWGGLAVLFFIANATK